MMEKKIRKYFMSQKCKGTADNSRLLFYAVVFWVLQILNC